MNLGNDLRLIADHLREASSFHEDDSLEEKADRLLAIAHTVESLELDRKNAKVMAEILTRKLTRDWDEPFVSFPTQTK